MHTPAIRRFRLLGIFAALTIVLNLLDGILTLAVVHGGAATEANPLMDVALSQGSVQFMLTKTSLVSLGVLLLWRLRSARLATAGLASAAATYSVIMLHHLQSLGALARLVG